MSVLLHQLVDRAAEKAPESPAFRFRGDEINYGDLAQKCNQLAAVLKESGVRKGDRVGLYLNKSLETAVSLFGVMKAGAAYVPLDPTASPARTRAVMRECGMRGLITHSPKSGDAHAVLTGADMGDLACVIGAEGKPDRTAVAIGWEEVYSAQGKAGDRLLEDDPAYIIFTSGSTGAPKGILHTHRSGLAYAERSATLYDVRPGDRLSNHSPLHFDMSTFDYLSGPFAGATTVIIPEQHAKMPASLSKLMETERLTHWYSVPFALIQLLEHGAIEKRDLSSLRWVMFGGEPFPAKHLLGLMQRLPQAIFSNVYGPAEVNQCTYHVVRTEDLEENNSPPIGRIWDIAESVIVDANDAPVAPGETGELMIRSATMMRGYWNRPDLNNSAFYEKRICSGVADRFYRTGDLVCDEGNGVLRFLGRKDRQIKLRGFRIELDEVEAALSAEPNIEEAAAVVIDKEDGRREIGAAVTLRENCTIEREALVRFASERLPSYAIPAVIEIFQSFPRTTSDKIDRKAVAGLLQNQNAQQEAQHA